MNRRDGLRATLYIMALFFVEPLALSGWLALIPYIKESLELSPGQLAIALLGSPLGLLPGLQVAGKMSARIGPRRLLRLSMPLMAASVIFVLFAGGMWTLFLALFVFGFLHAFPEVGINLYAGRLEKQAGLTVMNRCHGFWALGLMVGSGVVAASAHLGPLPVLTVVALIGGVAGVVLAQKMPKLAGDSDVGLAPPATRRFRDLPPILAIIGAYMLFNTLLEGAMADWAAVYLAEQTAMRSEQAGIAVTIYAGFMAGGRFCGDWLKVRMGAVALARVMIASAVLGMFLLILPLPSAALYPGFALVGFGIAVAYPLGVSAVASLDDRHESANIALMATVALCAFLAGPPLIGGLAERFSLTIGFAALIPPLLMAFFLAGWLEPKDAVREEALEDR